MNDSSFELHSPKEVASGLSRRLRQLRLERNWKQATLAERSGVSLGSLRRFEYSGEISLKNLLNLCAVLERLDDFNQLLEVEAARTMKELESLQSTRSRQRGFQ